MKKTYIKYTFFILFLASSSLLFYADSIKLSALKDKNEFLKIEFFLIWAGIFSYTLMTFNLVLAARISVFSNYFEGLDKAYFVHKLNGYLIFVFTILHFIKSGTLNNRLYGASALANNTFKNNFTSVFNQQAVNAGWVVFWFIIALIVLSVLKQIGPFRLLKYDKWKLSHKLFIIVFLSVTFHMIFIDKPFAGGTRIDDYLGICGAIGCFSLLWGQVRKYFARKKYNVVEVEHLKDTTKLVIEAQKSGLRKFNPGQFAFISFINKAKLAEPHPFTIALSNEGHNKLTFYIKKSGDFTNTIFETAAISDEMFVDGPHGNFVPNYKTNKSIFWVAGGVGITPFLSFVSAFESSNNTNVNLLYIVKYKDDLIGLPYLKAAQKLNPNFVYNVVVTSEDGRPTSESISSAFPNLGDDLEIYFCGPEGLRNNIVNILVKSGVKISKLKYEVFSFR